MNSTRLIAVALMAACLVAGWIAGSGGQAAHAQDATETVVETEEVEKNCRFEIPAEARLDGRPVLLDQCTGDTWRFDSGYDYSTNSYVRDYSWQSIARE